MKHQGTITLRRESFGWVGTFHNVPGMPNADLPLPFTADATLAQVFEDQRKRFPTAKFAGVNIIKRSGRNAG